MDCSKTLVGDACKFPSVVLRRSGVGRVLCTSVRMSIVSLRSDDNSPARPVVGHNHFWIRLWMDCGPVDLPRRFPSGRVFSTPIRKEIPVNFTARLFGCWRGRAALPLRASQIDRRFYRRSSFPLLPILPYPLRWSFWYFPPLRRSNFPGVGEGFSRPSASTGTRIDSIRTAVSSSRWRARWP